MPIAKHDSEFEFNPKPLPITPESFQNDRKITTPDRNFNEKVYFIFVRLLHFLRSRMQNLGYKTAEKYKTRSFF